MCNACGELTEGSHFLCLDQTGLRCLEVAIGSFSSVASGADLGLRTRAVCNVAVNENKATIRHRVSTNFDHTAIGPYALRAKLLIGVFKTPVNLCINIV